MCSECKGPLGTSDTSMLCEEGLSQLLHIIVLELLPISQIQGKTNGGLGKERSGCSSYTEFLIETLAGQGGGGGGGVNEARIYFKSPLYI